ncbi:Fumarylacetoacetate (FAA) hydrolase family protein [Noviherbaspirillum humi]|uniref:Fumarylacetoacetate (FAA) hydrolase family protein n=1 Tax=Noviherbaspirillum humi TaxID=1688639 RepID=A0A239JQ41_9BURK|nr:fumarylacetoacetate hydrolase family protein [Noviherbaspirillum humi]SNT07940.1 Fumarylacetoacetate (FAA) hydrolase family protein [Noviherbaspirillum humi]
MTNPLDLHACLPHDHESALLVGRVWKPGVGPVLVKVEEGEVLDLSPLAATSAELFELEELPARLRLARGLRRIASLAEALAGSWGDGRDLDALRLLAPCDLQAVKASGVTFVASMLERVIEEQARGDASRAAEVRHLIAAVIGDNLSRLVPGSPEALRLKEVLVEQGAWSQYLEVGIGPDAEIFTKTQPMAAVGSGAEVGIHPKSAWNNPEPEIVLAVSSRGNVLGAALGNDVNLRDFEGRSALLLGKAKDNNASCAIGPFIRVFDDGFTLDDVRRCDLALEVQGPDGFILNGHSSMGMISRDPLDLVAHAMGATHQYPDGMMLFLGTMFAPTQDRHGDGSGFTHEIGDIVSISSPRLGALVNRVNHCDRVPPWTFGAVALMRSLAKR